jgi:hypothetical protein
MQLYGLVQGAAYPLVQEEGERSSCQELRQSQATNLAEPHHFFTAPDKKYAYILYGLCYSFYKSHAKISEINENLNMLKFHLF